MNGPSPAYLANIMAGFNAGTSAASAPATPAASDDMLLSYMNQQPAPVAQPPPNASGFPSLADLANMPPPEVPIAPPPPPPAQPMQPPPPDDPAALMSKPPPNMSVDTGPIGPPPPPQVAGAPVPQPGPDPNAFPLIGMGGSGVAPAHEFDHRGPSLIAAQNARNEAVSGAIDTVDDRNQGAAAAEYGMALNQEREARDREVAYQQSVAERNEEYAQRQADFDQASQQMSRLGQTDRNRFWATRSTPGKVAGFLELMLAGFRGAPSMTMKAIDDDVKAQEFAYHAAADGANAKQTAFQMAMQKYGNADAARAMARVAAIDATQAQLGQIAATWKGTDAANRATEAAAQLQNEKMIQIQQGIQFIPAQSLGRRWVDPRTGLTYSETEAKAIMAKRDEWNQADRTETAKIGGQLLVQGAKVNEGAQKDQGERSVVVDGKDALAVNKTAAEKWNEYNHGRAVFNLALNKLKDAREAGDVGAYDAARAQLIEEYPKLLGYTRAPSEGQISHTVGPNAIPEYNHWYNHAITLGATYPMAQGRAEQKIKFLEETLATSDKAMRANTFGAAGSKPGAMPSSFGGYKK